MMITEEQKEKKRAYARAYSKKWRETHKEQKKEYDSKYCAEHKEQKSKRTAAYLQKNKKRIYANQNKRTKERRREDPVFRLRKGISSTIASILKLSGSSKKGQSCLRYLPYSLEELKKHVESKFEPWMNWSNQGVYVPSTWDDNDPLTWKWQLDHVIPKASLPYTSMEEDNFKKCWALENLRPLSAKQNVIDGATKIRH